MRNRIAHTLAMIAWYGTFPLPTKFPEWQGKYGIVSRCVGLYGIQSVGQSWGFGVSVADVELSMFGVMVATPSGTWFHYPWRGTRLVAHATVPGTSALTVLWKGDPAIHDLGLFFERAAKRMNTAAPYDIWVISSTEAKPYRVDHIAPISPEVLAEAQFVRFQCLPETEAGEPPLIVWANLDREVSPDQESIGVYLREQDLPSLEEEISAIVVKTTVAPQAHSVARGDLENEVREMLTYLESDLREAVQRSTP